MGSAQEPLEQAASGLAEVGAGEGLEEASLPDGSGVLDAAEQAPAGAACWTTGWSRAGVGRRDGVEAGVGWGDGVEPVDAAERAPARAACWTQPNGRRPGRRAGRSQTGAGRGGVLDAEGRASAGRRGGGGRRPGATWWMGRRQGRWSGSGRRASGGQCRGTMDPGVGQAGKHRGGGVDAGRGDLSGGRVDAGRGGLSGLRV